MSDAQSGGIGRKYSVKPVPDTGYQIPLNWLDSIETSIFPTPERPFDIKLSTRMLKYGIVL